MFFFSFLFTAQVFGQHKSVFEKTVDSLNLIGQSEKIIRYLEMQVKKHPENEILLRLTGYQYLQISNMVLGEKYYRKALSMNPTCSRCYLNIGLIYAAKNDFTQALTYLDTAVAIDPQDDRLFDARGTIYHHLKQPEKALEDYAKAIQLPSPAPGPPATRDSGHQTTRGSSPAHATIALDRCSFEPGDGSFSNSHRPWSGGTFRVDAPHSATFYAVG
jgi:tetratricopeptide (TPR) repeat protein